MTNDAPLSGIRVIELGSMYAAPTAGRMLRDFGADVVKIEDPASGDFAPCGARISAGKFGNVDRSFPKTAASWVK